MASDDGAEMDFVFVGVELLDALKALAQAEIAKGAGLSVSAWRQLHDVCAATTGAAPMLRAVPVVGRQPVMMPPRRQPIHTGGIAPARIVEVAAHDATPAQVIAPEIGNVRERPDVLAELQRVTARVGVAPAVSVVPPVPPKEGT
jgi:hypothetical protein